MGRNEKASKKNENYRIDGGGFERLRAKIKRAVRETIEEERVAIAKRRDAFHFGAIGRGKKILEIIVASGKLPSYYFSGKVFRERDVVLDGGVIYKVVLSQLPDETQWELLRLLQERFNKNKKLKLKVMLKAKHK